MFSHLKYSYRWGWGKLTIAFISRYWARYFSYWLFMSFQELFLYAPFLSAIPKNDLQIPFMNVSTHIYLFSTQDTCSHFLCTCVCIPYIYVHVSAQSWHCLSSLIALLFAYWRRASLWTQSSLILDSPASLLIQGISLVFLLSARITAGDHTCLVFM